MKKNISLYSVLFNYYIYLFRISFISQFSGIPLLLSAEIFAESFSFFSFIVLVFRIKKFGLSKIFGLIYVLGFLSFIILFFYVSRGYSWNKVLKWF